MRREIYSGLILLTFLSSVLTLDEESVKEEKCFSPKFDGVTLDFEWLLSNSVWYFPLQSKLDLYRTSWDLLQKAPSELTEVELKTSCLRSIWNGLSPMITGFGDKQLNYDFTPISDNEFVFTASWRDGDGGKMYLTKTDNESYIVFLKCWDDGQMTWNVMSTVKVLEPAAKGAILDYIVSQGFKEDNVFEEDYSNCVFKETKSEL